jgi:hypothetical protein
METQIEPPTPTTKPLPLLRDTPSQFGRNDTHSNIAYPVYKRGGEEDNILKAELR